VRVIRGAVPVAGLIHEMPRASRIPGTPHMTIIHRRLKSPPIALPGGVFGNMPHENSTLFFREGDFGP